MIGDANTSCALLIIIGLAVVGFLILRRRGQ